MEGLNRVYLAFGSNLGPREQHIQEALDTLKFKGIQIEKVSNYFYSKAHGYDSINEFCNLCVKAFTAFSPIELLNTIKSIEAQMGRQPRSQGMPYKDRIIDIDIIFYNDLEIWEKDLIIPHPMWSVRAFVYLPLIELANTQNI